MSDKVRIHDLAKQYGMPGKDLASKLRDFGFSKAKSHMSALDQFELVQAQGLLEANGIMPTVTETPDEGEDEGGGLRVKKRKKLENEDSVSGMPGIKRRKKPAAAEPAPAPKAPKPAPRPAPAAEPAPVLPVAPEPAPAAAQASAQATSGASAQATPAPVEAPAPTAKTVEPKAQAAPAAAPPATKVKPAAEAADAPPATAPPVEAPEPAAPVAATPKEETPVEPPATKEPSASEVAAAKAAEEAEAAKAAARAQEIAAAEAELADRAAVRSKAIDAENEMSPIKRSIAKKKREEAEAALPPIAMPEPEPALELEPEAAAEPAAAELSPGGEAAADAPKKDEEAAAGDADDGKGARRGNVVGFIDPSSFAQSTPARRRPDSRRIQGRDDATPDVRPTFGRDRGRSQTPTGPRGKMTAAELREREQGRFLRRNRAAGGPPGRRSNGPGGRGGSRDTVTLSPYSGQKVRIDEPITITKLSDAMSLKSSVVQKRALERQYGMFTVNQTLDTDTATLLASEFEVELDVREEVTAEQQLIEEVNKKRSEIEEENLTARAPTVAFLGHVDHGKTTLIDKIRESKVADKESGGITQHIGAYQVHTKKGHSVTIVDTPGHEAFTAMRARGAKAVDIVVLVVAGDDGVKPSTIEAINHAKFAETPIVVAINKKDRPEFNANTVIQQLMGQELVPEQYGGSVAMFETSGMSGEGIEELLEHIFLMGDMELGLKAHPEGPASGVVLEAEIQQGRGIVAHLLVQDGTLQRGDVILAGEGYGKVRQLLDDRGKTLKEAGPSTPVSVTGLDALPGVGQPFHVIDTLAQAKEIAGERERSNRAVMLASKREPTRELEAILGSAPKTERETINVIVRTDVQGSAEVLRQEIESLEHDEVQVKLIHSGVGPITESDVDLASTSAAILIAFQVSVNPKARQEAERKGLTVRRYSVLYEVLDDLRRVMEGALKPEFLEEITGHVEIRQIFKSSKIGLIAGCMVLDGTIKRNSKCRLLRDGNVVYTGAIGSLRREKDEANEVRTGFECGIVLRDFRDIREGDVVETYRMKEIKRTL